MAVNSDQAAVYMIEGYHLRGLFDITPGLATRFYKYLATIVEKRLWQREKQIYYNSFDADDEKAILDD